MPDRSSHEIRIFDAPDGLEPTAITDNVVVGIHEDGLGVERVEVHALTRAGGQAR